MKMSKTLYVPDHIAKKRKIEKQGDLQKAYVAPEIKQLDPSKLESNLLDKLPQPTGWRILLLPYQGQKQTSGGILVPDEVREREALATVCGYVLKVGPLAYQDPNKFGENEDPWCKEKDWVIFGRYAGSRFKIEGGEVRILNDDEIIARIGNPDDILHI
jgi:chaperonin GroES|tara:strand:- start:545 stop:1021 length:477 start_codon:yes stop_codon:yes gene_type:complete